MEEAVAVERLYQLAMNIGQVDPAIMDNINHDVAIRTRANLLGVPKTVLRGEDEVEEIRQERAAAQQAQQEAMMQAQQAQTAKTNAQAMNEATQNPNMEEIMQADVLPE